MTNSDLEAKRAHWRGILEDWSGSGLTKAGFCRENDLREWQFHYWFARLRERNSDAGFARVEAVAPSGVCLRLANGLALELTGDFDEAVLARFLVVASRSC